MKSRTLFLSALLLFSTTAPASVGLLQSQIGYIDNNSAPYHDKLAMMTTTGNKTLPDLMEEQEGRQLQNQRLRIELEKQKLELEKLRRESQGGEVVQCKKMCDGQGNCRIFCPE